MACEDIQAKLDLLEQKKVQIETDLKDLGPNPNQQIKAKFEQELAQTKIAISVTEKELENCLNPLPNPACEAIQTKLDSLKQTKVQLETDLKDLGPHPNQQIKAKFEHEIAQTKIAISVTEKELEDCLSQPPHPPTLAPQYILTTNFNNPYFAPSDPANQQSFDPDWASNLVGGKAYPEDTDYEWVQVLNPSAGYPIADHDADLVGLSGWAVNPELSTGDVWFSHPFGFDWEFYVAPDPQYASLLAASNKMSDDADYSAARQDAANIGLSVPGVLGIETDQGLIPEEYRAQEGDRVAVFGRWIVDAGEKDFHSEIHPPLLLVTARVASKTIAPHGPLHTLTGVTETRIISRPYLVGQIYEVDNEPLYEHMIDEIAKVESIFGSTQLEAHPKIPPKPFSGVQLITYTVKPPTPPPTPWHRLSVTFHFTVRNGVTVQLIGDSDSVTVVILMNETAYIPAPRPPKHDRTISLEDLSNANQSIDTTVDWLNFFNALFNQYALIIENVGGVLTDSYDPPQASSVHDSEITKMWASDLRGSTRFSIDDIQPFPIYGFLNVEWEPYQPQGSSLGQTNIPYQS